MDTYEVATWGSLVVFIVFCIALYLLERKHYPPPDDPHTDSEHGPDPVSGWSAEDDEAFERFTHTGPGR